MDNKILKLFEIDVSPLKKITSLASQNGLDKEDVNEIKLLAKEVDGAIKSMERVYQTAIKLADRQQSDMNTEESDPIEIKAFKSVIQAAKVSFKEKINDLKQLQNNVRNYLRNVAQKI